MSYNRAIIEGRLGRDPDLRYLQSGTAVCNLSIATDESYKDQQGNKVEKVEWHKINVWGKQAENCAQYLAKGRQCLVEGSLQTKKYQDQQGVDRYSTEIKAQRVVFLGGGSNQGQPQQPQQQPAQNQQQPGPSFPENTEQLDESPFALALIPLAGALAAMLSATNGLI